MATWTARDQKTLDELKQRRDDFMRENRDPLYDAVRCLKLVALEHEVEDLAEELIANADKFRDLLAPFDSGVRPG